MNIDYWINWAKRAAADLREYAEAAEQSGASQPRTEALLSEFDDLLADRPTWKYQPRYTEGDATTLLDEL